VVEKEVDGEPIPEPVKLPITANGRIFPRDDVDLWEFDAAAGQTITAFAHAKSINSPLVPKLEILDAAGKVLAETMTHPVVGADASVRFIAPSAGKSHVGITDARSSGGPQYVYRLTLTSAAVPDHAFPLDVPADGLRDVTEPGTPAAPPVALNGRIEAAGAAGEWKVEFKRGRRYAFDFQAGRSQSPLCGTVTLLDPTGKELARRESDGTGDPGTFALDAPADGVYTVRVTERFTGRSGPAFVYRLRVLDPAADPPEFRLTLPADTLTVPRAGNAKLKVTAERQGGFTGPITLDVTGLPDGVSVSAATIPANGKPVDLMFTPPAPAPIPTAKLTVTGKAMANEKAIPATPLVPGTRSLPDEPSILLAVGMPTPFKIVDQYVMTSAPRGELYRRKYKIDRGGFDGPIRVSLADRQARHLQGGPGPLVVGPPGGTEFEYPALLAPSL